MRKYFIGLCWNDEFNPYFHLRDFETGVDEFCFIPREFSIERFGKKVCIGVLNPYTREYISCNTIIEEDQTQCNKCKYLLDFYKCIRCHGGECYVKSDDILKYCKTPHYVYLAYFPNEKIKVGIASEVKKYDRLLEQGAIFSIFIAKAPTGKIARQIEKDIIDNGISGAVTTTYKMKNLIFSESLSTIKKVLIEKYTEILKFVSDKNLQYLIKPEFNFFNEIKDSIDDNMLMESVQFNLFNEELKQNRPYVVKKDLGRVSGIYLFAVGKILAIEHRGIVELIDTRKMEGYLFEFDDLIVYEKVKYIRSR